MLDDTVQATGIVAQHAPVARRVGELGRQKRRRVLNQRLERGWLQQRYVAVQNEHRRGRVHPGHRLEDGVPRAELLLLQHPGQVRRIECRPDLLRAVADHHVDALRREAARRIEYVCQQRSAGEGVQYFRQVRTHPRSLAGGEDDDFERHGSL